MGNPPISVIIPTYNRLPVLGRAVQSVLKQTFSDFELILIDDGSSDGTERWIQSQGFPIRYFYQDHCGVSTARNRGIRESRGEWISFLDSDDVWHKQKLEKQMDYLREKPDIQICQTNEIWFRNGRRVNSGKKHQKQGGWIFQNCLPACAISPSAVMMHKTIFKTVGFFDENLPACEDYDLWLRVALHFSVGLLEDSLVIKYGGHSDQLSRQIWGLDRFRIESLRKIFTAQKISLSQKQQVAEEIIKKGKILLSGCLKRKKNEESKYYSEIISEFQKFIETHSLEAI